MWLRLSLPFHCSQSVVAPCSSHQRLVSLRDHAVGHVGAAVFQQRVEHVFRAEDAGIDVVVGLLHGGDEVGQHAGLVIRFHQPLVKRATERGLAAVVVAGRVGVIELLVESDPDTGGQLGVFPGVVLSAEQSGGQGDDLRVHIVVSGVGDASLGLGLPRRPVVEADLYDAIFAAGGEVSHVTLQAVVMAAKVLRSASARACRRGL